MPWTPEQTLAWHQQQIKAADDITEAAIAALDDAITAHVVARASAAATIGGPRAASDRAADLSVHHESLAREARDRYLARYAATAAA